MTLNYQLTLDEFMDAMLFSLHKTLKPLKILFILMGFFFFVIAFFRFAANQAPRLIFTDVFMGILFFCLFRVISTFNIRSQWKLSFYYRQNIQMKIDGVALEQSNNTFRLNTKWEGYVSFWETEKLFALCLLPNMYQIIPKRAFANENDLNQFRAWALQIGREAAQNPPLPEPK